MNKEYLNDFYNYLTNEKRYSIHTVSAYKRDLSLFFDYVEKENIETIDKLCVQGYFSKLYTLFPQKSM